MKVQFINNWIYKGKKWNKLFGYYYNLDWFNIKHLLVGVFNFYIFITWR
jgi:hypothetical protein